MPLKRESVYHAKRLDFSMKYSSIGTFNVGVVTVVLKQTQWFDTTFHSIDHSISLLNLSNR